MEKIILDNAYLCIHSSEHGRKDAKGTLLSYPTKKFQKMDISKVRRARLPPSPPPPPLIFLGLN